MNELEARGIPPGDVFKRTSYFTASLDEAARTIHITAHAIVDSSRTVILVDRLRGVPLFCDPLDHVAIEPVEPEGRSHEPVLSQDSMSLHERLEMLHHVGFEDPQRLKSFIERQISDTSDTATFSRIRDEILGKVHDATLGFTGIRMITKGCLNTALRLVTEAQSSQTEMFSTKLLFRSYVRLLLDGNSTKDCLAIIKALRDGKYPDYSDLDIDVRVDVKRALQLNRKIVDQFVEKLWLPPEDFEMSVAERPAWNFERTIEAAGIAATFFAAADTLDPAGETTATVFFKAEEAFESAYAARIAGAPPALARIQKILTGEPLRGSEIS